MSIVLNGTTGITSTGITETSDGKVGIGTNSPAANLHISSTGTPTLRIQDADGSDYYAQISQATGNTIFDARYGASNGAFIFRGLGGGVPVERMRILPSGGITFNGDTSAANALDDYEEGTFTPVFADAATGGNTSPTVGEGVYTKIGNLVYVCINLTNIDTTGLTASNSIIIRNLPFTSSNSSVYGTGSIFGRITCNGKYLTPRIGLPGSSYCIIDDNPGTTSNPTAAVVSAIVDDGGDIRMSLTYTAA